MEAMSVPQWQAQPPAEDFAVDLDKIHEARTQLGDVHAMYHWQHRSSGAQMPVNCSKRSLILCRDPALARLPWLFSCGSLAAPARSAGRAPNSCFPIVLRTSW
jgi:hypothetical protein